MDFVMKGESEKKMTNFIEVHHTGTRKLVNLLHVQEIVKDSSGRCTMYFLRADYFTPDEGYDDIVDMLRKAGQYLEGHKKYD